MNISQWFEKRTTTANTGNSEGYRDKSSSFIRMSTTAIEKEAKRTSILFDLEVVRKFFCTFAVPQDDPTFCHVFVGASRGKARKKTPVCILCSCPGGPVRCHSRSRRRPVALTGWDVVRSMLLFSSVKETLLPGPLPSRVSCLPWPSCAATLGETLRKNSPGASHGGGVGFQSFRGRKRNDVKGLLRLPSPGATTALHTAPSAPHAPRVLAKGMKSRKSGIVDFFFFIVESGRRVPETHIYIIIIKMIERMANVVL